MNQLFIDFFLYWLATGILLGYAASKIIQKSTRKKKQAVCDTVWELELARTNRL